MKKILLLVLLILSAILGYSFGRPFDLLRSLRVNQPGDHSSYKRVILKVGLVADSHNENDLLGKALAQAGGMGINFIIGLGDYTNLGTVEELSGAKNEFDKSKLPYFLTAGDRDGWQSRGRNDGIDNFKEVLGKATQVFERDGVQFVLLDNSDIYKGLSTESLELSDKIANWQLSSQTSKLTFVFAHKTPFHPESRHVMGENSPQVAQQAKSLLALLEGHRDKGTENIKGIEAEGPERSRRVDGFFAGDLHFFARYNSPGGSVKITTIGAVAAQRNFQGPRFGVLTVWDDYSWEVDDVEIR